MSSNINNIEESRNHMDLLLNKAKDKILDAEDVTIFTHTDCDGITAGSILSSILDKLEIDHTVNFVEINEVESLDTETDLTIISDLGAGQNIANLCNNSNSSVIVLDHHPPIRKLGTELKGDLIEINPNYERYTFIGTTQLNVQGFYVLECYNTSDVNEEGYPRYCSGIWVTTNGVYFYHVTNYVYYETILS